MSMPLSSNNSVRFIQSYYLATPLFFIIDWVLGVNIRLVIPGGEDILYYLYYALCFIAGFLALKSDLLAALIALLECSVNILLLLLGILWPLLTIGDRIEAGAEVVYTFGMAELIHFAIAGSMLVLAFYQNPLMKRVGGIVLNRE